MSGPEDPSRLKGKIPSRLKGAEVPIIQVLGGIAWQEAPRVRRHGMIKEGNSWYVSGVERVETEGTAGWRHGERYTYLQEDGSWGRKVHYFPTEDAAKSALETAIGTTKSSSAQEPSAFELAMRAAEEKKKKGAKK